jgi:hypothetical protein
MRKADRRERLKSALEKAGSGWVFRYWGNDTARNLDRVAADLDRFIQEYHRLFGERPDPYLLMEENPLKGAAFFQVDTLLASVEMKVMVWRILLGCEIAQVKWTYEAGKGSSLKVVLRPPYGGKEESYTGQQPADFRVLRHFGATGVDGQLILQGYYAARGAG